MLQGSEADLLRSSRSGPVRHRLCSGPVPGQDGELLQAGRDLLRRQDLLLLGSEGLLWQCCWCYGRTGEGSSSAAEGRSRSGSKGLIASWTARCANPEIELTLTGRLDFFAP